MKDGQFFHRKVDLEIWDVEYFSFTKQWGVPHDNGVRHCQWLALGGIKREPFKARKGTRVELAVLG
jgi:hypothetical protein